MDDIPQLFHCNAFCILSNAIETRVGSFTAGWEHLKNIGKFTEFVDILLSLDVWKKSFYVY